MESEPYLAFWLGNGLRFVGRPAAVGVDFAVAMPRSIEEDLGEEDGDIVGSEDLRGEAQGERVQVFSKISVNWL